MANTNSSTISTQTLIDYARTFDWAVPTVGLAGYDDEPALSFAQDITFRLMNRNNPWKWNSYIFTPFYTQPYMQDYPTSISQNTLGWLEDCTIVDINNTAQPLPRPPIRCVARLLPTYAVGIPSEICWIPNRISQTGVWPGANTVYTNPLVSAGGGPGNNPKTAITDPNGNIEVVTTYGTTTSNPSGPSWPAANAAAGITTNDGTVVWTVQDPNGVALRLNAMATFGSNVWQVNPIYQQKPPLITTLTTTFAPIPDDLQYLIKQGFLAMCWKKSDKKTFKEEYAQWLEDIQEAMGASDREPQEFGIYPATSLQGGGPQGNGVGTWGYPGWEGWSSGGY